MDRKWCTKYCWFRLLTSMTVMRVACMRRWYRNVKSKRDRIVRSKCYSNEFEGCYDIVVRNFSYILCARLSDKRQKQKPKMKMVNILHEVNDAEMKLDIIKRDS